MKFVIQRVAHAEVAVEGEVIGKIGKGFMVLIGVAQDDTREIADKMVKKLTGLRIFEDENGKTNLALKDVDGELLLISQFTLYANCKKGFRPSFIEAGACTEYSDRYGNCICNADRNLADHLPVYLHSQDPGCIQQKGQEGRDKERRY